MELEITQINTDPRHGNIMDPNMNLMCLWCGKDYKPYNHLVIHEYAFFGFCSVRCFNRYHSVLGKVWKAIKWPFWKIRSEIIIWNDNRHSIPCKCCGEDMITMTSDLQYCDNINCEMWGFTVEVTSHENKEYKFLFEEEEVYAKEKRKGPEGEGEEEASKEKTCYYRNEGC